MKIAICVHIDISSSILISLSVPSSLSAAQWCNGSRLADTREYVCLSMAVRNDLRIGLSTSNYMSRIHCAVYRALLTRKSSAPIMIGTATLCNRILERALPLLLPCWRGFTVTEQKVTWDCSRSQNSYFNHTTAIMNYLFKTIRRRKIFFIELL